MRVVIIDDMELARESLKADLAHFCPELELVGEADGVVSAAKLLKQTAVDLIFLDIQMDDGDGFDVLDIVPEYKARVIFTTASDEYAIKAFQYAALDYLLKPIDPELLVTAVEKSKLSGVFDGAQKNILEEKSFDKIVLNTAEEMRVVHVSEIVRCESMGNYTQFFFTDGTKMLVTRTLKDFDQMLADKNFLRVHQSHLVNLDFVNAYVKTEGGYLLLTDKSRIPVSVRKKSTVLKIVSQLK